MTIAEEFQKDSSKDFPLIVCSANVFELILIPHEYIFKTVLNYLSGEYHGYFMYYHKTIEDRFYVNFNLDAGQVRINGEGTNNLGNFNVLGFVNFYSSKGNSIINARGNTGKQ